MSELLVQHALRNNFNRSGRADIFSPNAQVFDWESDLLQVTKSRFVNEYEIKCSRADLMNDFKNKPEKHIGLKTGIYENRVYKHTKERIDKIKSTGEGMKYLEGWEKSLAKQKEFFPIPNYFWFVIVGFENFKLEEIPDYAGVMTFTPRREKEYDHLTKAQRYLWGNIEFLRHAPRLHKNKLDDEHMIKALKSIQYRFWDLHAQKIIQ